MKFLCHHLLDILENSVRAKSTEITLKIHESDTDHRVNIIFTDNGCGMSEEMQKSVLDPFVTSRTTRKIGLGLPLFQQNAQRSGGDLTIKSEIGVGTVVTVWFEKNNIDLPPWGDVAGTLVQLMISYKETNFIYEHQTETGEFSLQSNEIMEIICENGRPVLAMINSVIELINNNLSEIKALN